MEPRKQKGQEQKVKLERQAGTEKNGTTHTGKLAYQSIGTNIDFKTRCYLSSYSKLSKLEYDPYRMFQILKHLSCNTYQILRAY